MSSEEVANYSDHVTVHNIKEDIKNAFFTCTFIPDQVDRSFAGMVAEAKECITEEGKRRCKEALAIVQSTINNKGMSACLLH